MAQKMLVTGGCGFIGSNFVRHILANNDRYEIVNLDTLTYAGNLENLRDVENHPRYTFVKGDICDEDLVNRLLADGADVIVNFAAESHVDRSITDPGVFVRVNVLGTQTLLAAAKEHGVPRFVQISTDEVYGSLGPEGLFTEETPLQPNSPYSAAKAGADLLVRAYHQTYGFPGLITRCSNNYGPYQFPEKLIPLFISNALEDKPLPLYGDGMNVRDWIYVDDHCRGIEAVVEKGRPGEVYNIGGNNELANVTITKEILKQLGKPESLITFVKDRPGHDRRYAIDSTKIQTELGWQPTVSLADGMARTVQWYQDHREWWERIKSGEYMEYYDRHYCQAHGLKE
ncbi:MAG: dTDP-glucose 4,6-dehydratase [Planctomycetes bacterium]|nr:dTDP-glucose 4,6-dehydratase [Planctomycetota bacterium]